MRCVEPASFKGIDFSTSRTLGGTGRPFQLTLERALLALLLGGRVKALFIVLVFPFFADEKCCDYFKMGDLIPIIEGPAKIRDGKKVFLVFISIGL